MRRHDNPALAGMRWHSVRKYLVFYIPRSDGIEVVRVLHGARDLEALFRLKAGPSERPVVDLSGQDALGC